MPHRIGRPVRHLSVDCLLPGFFLIFFYVPVSPFSQRLILIWFAFKSFLLWVYCLKFCIWEWKRKILPRCKHHGIKETVGFFGFFSDFIFWKSRQPWILYRSTSAMPSSLLLHTYQCVHTTGHWLKHISNTVLPSLTHAQMHAHMRTYPWGDYSWRC